MKVCYAAFKRINLIRSSIFYLNKAIPNQKKLAFDNARTMASTSSSDTIGTQSFHMNRLVNEKSPYLLQHASNPVDWYPWSNEAIQKARDENKPIFLSIGYSTCHWCHVMEKESFENEEVAKIMNAHFVSIKVDREERPDVDKVYMTYVQATTGSGGWPLSIWLTPELTPIYGGTYFPPNDRSFGKPGFKTVMQAIAQKWADDKQNIQDSGTAIMKLLAKEIQIKDPNSKEVPSMECVHRCYQVLSKAYDPINGGFSKAPKFPQAVILNFLMRYFAHTGAQNHLSKEMCLYTLKLMARGGIHDHLAKGFHRYSTDAEWHVPHFEKMLYDQAQLAVIYAEAFQLSKIKLYGDVAHGILLYVNRDLSDNLGGFYSAEDADSYPNSESTTKHEGAFCVWNKKEVDKLLNSPLVGNPKYKLSHLFCTFFNIKDGGNVKPYQDPHDEFKHMNVLIIRSDKEKIAEDYRMSLDDLKENILKGCKILFEARLKRPVPHLDDKMIAAWNGLMISGFAKCGMIFGEQKYVDRAIKAATFIKENLYLPEKNVLLRSFYHSSASPPPSVEQLNEPIEGFVDDYAFVIQSLLDLYHACADSSWLNWAEQLQKRQDELFWDAEMGGYFLTTGTDASVILRMKDDQDGAEPCANSVSVTNLLRLSAFLDDPQYREQAEKILVAFSDRLNKVPHALPHMICGLMMYHQTIKRIIIAGDKESDELKAMLNTIHSIYIPNKVVIFADGDTNNFMYDRVAILGQLIPKQGKPTVYICEANTCSLPISSLEELSTQLHQKKYLT